MSLAAKEKMQSLSYLNSNVHVLTTEMLPGIAIKLRSISTGTAILWTEDEDGQIIRTPDMSVLDTTPGNESVDAPRVENTYILEVEKSYVVMVLEGVIILRIHRQLKQSMFTENGAELEVEHATRKME
jgi:hypothetical protein